MNQDVVILRLNAPSEWWTTEEAGKGRVAPSVRTCEQNAKAAPPNSKFTQLWTNTLFHSR